jgi:hypothetical protein
MAKTLGIKWVIFNCSDQINCQTLGRIFEDLARSGCERKFDEFN